MADAARAILEERARRLALVEPDEPAAGEITSVVVVAVAEERYALPLEQVAEIEPLGTPTPVPGAPPAWLGLLNLRGRMCPVVRLGRALGRPAGADTDGNATVVVVRSEGAEVGLLVAEVTEIRRLRLSELSPPLPDAGSAAGDCCVGITPDLVCLLDPDRLLGAAGVGGG